MRKLIWGNDHCHWVKRETLTFPKSRGGLGVCPTRDINISLLRKHIGDMEHEKQNLWLQMLESKYLKDRSILHASLENGVSNSMVKALDHLKLGFKFRIGKGNTSLWYNKWLDDDFFV